MILLCFAGELFSQLALWMFQAPGMKYQKGYNADLGDKNIAMKFFSQRKWGYNWADSLSVLHHL